jgi:hypothetical protein
MLSELLLVTGMPSPGKARLRAALEAAELSIAPPSAPFRVHAETDLEAMLEPGLLRETRAAAAEAHIVIPVDWESPEASVRRVIAVLSKPTQRAEDARPAPANGAQRGA